MKLLTIPEACERLRISRATLYKLVKRGTLTLVKVGGKSLVPEETLWNLLAAPAGPGDSEERSCERCYEELLRLALTTAESRQASVRPKFSEFVPIEVKGKAASELIIEERGAR
ncbi:MAG: helix-turn-helix domain-containing protein [Candidatus Methylomirabilia bacterium]